MSNRGMAIAPAAVGCPQTPWSRRARMDSCPGSGPGGGPFAGMTEAWPSWRPHLVAAEKPADVAIGRYGGCRPSRGAKGRRLSLAPSCRSAPRLLGHLPPGCGPLASRFASSLLRFVKVVACGQCGRDGLSGIGPAAVRCSGHGERFQCGPFDRERPVTAG